jgi:hypothetical protein
MNKLIIVFYISCTFPFSQSKPPSTFPQLLLIAHLPKFRNFNPFARNVVDIVAMTSDRLPSISGEEMCLRDQVCEQIEQQDTSSWI